MENIWFEPTEGEEDVGEVDTDKDLDPDSSDTNIDSDPDGINLPELEFTMNGSKNDDEDVDEVEEDEDDVDDDEDDIHMDEGDCDDELEPQFKKKKTK